MPPQDPQQADAIMKIVRDYGYAAVNAYLPSAKIASAVAVTYQPEAFNNEGQYSNGGDTLFRKIGAYLAPNDAPPTRLGQ